MQRFSHSAAGAFCLAAPCLNCLCTAAGFCGILMEKGGASLMKRILDCHSSDFLHISRQELLDAIASSEGRTLACETIGAIMPMLGDITNAEFAAAMGADILLLNMFDVQKPVIHGLPKTEPEMVIRKLKELTVRPVGINLEPVEQVLSSEDPEENMWAMTSGRKATLENARKAVNCTPFVGQCDILNNKWGVLLCQKEYQTKDIHRNSRNK